MSKKLKRRRAVSSGRKGIKRKEELLVEKEREREREREMVELVRELVS